jgi:hypothetical protein
MADVNTLTTASLDSLVPFGGIASHLIQPKWAPELKRLEGLILSGLFLVRSLPVLAVEAKSRPVC